MTCLGFGRMAMGEHAWGSATPAGIMRLLEHYRSPLDGQARRGGRTQPDPRQADGDDAAERQLHGHHLPLAHPGPAAPSSKQADIVVGAVGKPEFITAHWIRDGAVVVDAGYHPGGVGDIELAAAPERVAAYTPVPGGVGPMTINTLILQTVQTAERALG